MAKKEKKPEVMVDINSGDQVKNAYGKKKGAFIAKICCSSLVMLIGIALIFASIAPELLTGCVTSGMTYKQVDDQPLNEKETIATNDSGNISTSFTDSELLSDPKVLNVMIFGEDNHSKKENGRSDSMMLLSIDTRSKAIKITSFQRDTYLYIPGYGYDKMNASYPFGGPSLAIRTVEANFGIKIDRYAAVDFKSFRKIIDKLGGIDLELTADEIEYINYQMYKNNQVTDRNTIKDEPGMVHLNGLEALWFARDRGLSVGEDGNEIGLDGDDWDRTSRQRRLMDKLFKDLKEASFDKIISIVSEVGPYITTNFTKEEITGLLTRSLTYLQYDLKKYGVPQNGLWSYYNDEYAGSCIQINDMEKCRKKLVKFVFGENASTKAATTAATE